VHGQSAAAAAAVAAAAAAAAAAELPCQSLRALLLLQQLLLQMAQALCSCRHPPQPVHEGSLQSRRQRRCWSSAALGAQCQGLLPAPALPSGRCLRCCLPALGSTCSL
jgi:hypothetical protein